MAVKNLGRVVGKSAYESWLDSGNEGTEKDFIESLKGTSNSEITVNVKEYGAVGDGSTDDTEAIALAIEHVVDNGILFFPAGTYCVDNIMLKSNMTVKGEGKSSIVKLNDNAPSENYWNNCFTIYQIENVNIENITLDGNKDNNASTGESADFRLNGVIIQESNNITLHHLLSRNNGYHGCIMNDVDRIEISECEFYDNGFRPFHGHGTILNSRFINNRCINNGLGVEGNVTSSGGGYDGIFFFDNVQNLTISGNYVESNSTACIDLGGAIFEGQQASENIIVENNILKPSGTFAGIEIIGSDCNKLTITNNHVINGRFGVYGQDGSKNPIGSYVNICNNIFRTTIGIRSTIPVKNWNISNNQFIWGTEGGILLTGATNTRIIGNLFEPNGPWTPSENKDCIILTNCSNTIVANNSFYNRSSGHYSQYGVKEAGTTDSSILIGNSFQAMAIGAYLLVGENSKAVNNIVNGVFETTTI